VNHTADVFRAGRSLVRRPGFLLLASATLALGVAVLLGTLTLLDALLLQPPPWPNHQRVVVYGGRTAGDPMRAISPRLYAAVGLPPSLLSTGIARVPETVNVLGGAHRELLRAQRVDEGFLATLGVVPFHEESGTGARDGVLVSTALWRRWLADESETAGRTLVVDGQPMKVRGVLPPDYRFFSDIDLLLPLNLWDSASDRAENMTAIARLAPDHDVSGFSAEVESIADRDAEALSLRPDDLRWYGATPVDELVARGARGSLWLFAACAVLVLAVAGVNVSHLMSTRMFGRIHETALKIVFGASGWRPWLPALIDATGVGLLACAVGIPVGSVMLGLFQRFLPSSWLTSALPPAPGWRVVLAVVAMTLVVVLLAAVSGATKVRTSLLHREQSAMGGFTNVGRTAGHVRSTLVVVQVALATLLVSLGVAAASRAWRLARAAPGFDSAGTVVVELHAPVRAYPEVHDVVRLLDAIGAGVMRLQGVDSMGWSTQPAAGRGFKMSFLHADGTREFVQYALTTPGGNRGMGLRKLAGRWIEPRDGADAECVALVNEAYLRRFASDGVGDIVRPEGAPGQVARIVGVVGDTWSDGGTSAKPTVFLALAQASAGRFARVRELAPLYAVIRGPAAASVARDALPRIVQGLAPSLVVSAPIPLERIARMPLATAHRNVVLFSTLSMFAVGLAAVGQYSVQAVEVAAARNAIALRGALGATPAHLLARVFRKALYVAMAGIALGLLAALALQRSLSEEVVALPGEVGPGVTAIAAIVMALAAVAATFVPACRAASTEPWRVLRSD
jgi:predicted permease